MGAHSSGEPGVRGEISSATNTHSAINQVIVLGMLASAMDVLQASLITETYEESGRVYVLLKGVYIQINRSQRVAFSDVILVSKIIHYVHI